jgi:hypothetical protein
MKALSELANESSPLLLVPKQETNMSKTSKVAFVAAVVAIGISSPVLAQSRDDGRNAYGMVPHEDSNSPAFTGGGSAGYNTYQERDND